MAKKMLALAGTALLVLPLALFLRTYSPSPLPEPAPLLDVLPAAMPPEKMAVFQLPAGIIHRSAAAAYRGGSYFDKREFSTTAVLVKHPRGDLLIDTGFGRNIDAHFKLLPLPLRLITSYSRLLPVADRLTAARYDRKQLRAIILTHAHWDHVSGVPDLPDTPVWVTAEERRYIMNDRGPASAVVRSLLNVNYKEYGFEGGAFLGFARSHDVYGDGAVVIVPAPGHTPGSVIVFLALPSGKRYALVGDLVWQREGIVAREEKPWLTRTAVDLDPAGVRTSMLRMAAIAARFPALIIVPAHDARGFADMPQL